jgi:hypothetical protein
MRSKDTAGKDHARGPREERECRSCYGAGVIVEDVELKTGEKVAQPATCFICRGAGVVSVYLYPKPRQRSR